MKALLSLLLLLGAMAHAERIDIQKEGAASDIAKVLRGTVGMTVSCGDDVDMQTCKYFTNAVSVDLRSKGVSVFLYYDPEVIVQSFYVPPRLEEVPITLTVRLIESGPPDKTVLYLGGFCFTESAVGVAALQSQAAQQMMNSIGSGQGSSQEAYPNAPNPYQLPRWRQMEKGGDIGPTVSEKAEAASRLAKEFSSYWISVSGQSSNQAH